MILGGGAKICWLGVADLFIFVHFETEPGLSFAHAYG